jgi:hypothetical protein
MLSLGDQSGRQCAGAVLHQLGQFLKSFESQLSKRVTPVTAVLHSGSVFDPLQHSGNYMYHLLSPFNAGIKSFRATLSG